MSSSTASSQRPSILALALPSISLLLIFTLVNLAVIKIVAGLGTDGIAAVTTGSRVFFIVYSAIMGLGAGATALIAYAWGGNNKAEAEIYLSLSLKLGLFISALFSLAFVIAVPYLCDLFNLQGQARIATIDYVRFSSLFNINIAIILIITTGLRAAGDGWMPFYLTAITNIIYLPLCAGLTYGWDGFAWEIWGWKLFSLPDMGIRGTAIGGGIAYLLGSILTWYLWRRQKLILGFSATKLKQQWPMLKRLWQVSYPAIAEQLIIQLALFSFLTIVATYSTEAFAAYGVGLGLLSITIVVGAGFGVAASALVGQELGAGKPEAAVSIGYRTLLWACLTMSFLGGLTIYFATPLASAMVDDPEVIRLTSVFLIMLGVSQPLMSVDMALGGALRGAGDTRFPLISTFCGFIVTRLATAFLFMQLGLSVEWIFGALIGDYIVKAGMIFWRFHSRVWVPKV